MARWLLGLKEDVISAQKTFRMLNAFITSCGDLTGHDKLSKAEMSWLRLRAGCVMLRIIEQKGVGDQYNAEQFYDLSHLIVVSKNIKKNLVGTSTTTVFFFIGRRSAGSRNFCYETSQRFKPTFDRELLTVGFYGHLRISRTRKR